MDSFKDSLNEILENNKVILVYPIPAAKFDVVKKIMNEVPKNNFKATEYLNKNKITTDYSYYLKRNKRVVNFFENIKHPNLYKIYPDQIFCDKIVQKKCFTHEGKNIFYSDKHHLSFFGAEKLAKKIFNQILEINNLAKN